MNNYKEELFKTCNIDKGFSDLLYDTSMHLDFYNYKHRADPMMDYYKKVFRFDCSDIQTQYFFRHLNAYFRIEKKLTDKEKEKQIIASMLAFNKKPLIDLIHYLNNIIGTIKLSSVLSSLNDGSIALLTLKQRKRKFQGTLPINLDMGSYNDLILPIIPMKKEDIDIDGALYGLYRYFYEKNQNGEDYKTVTNSQTQSNVVTNDKKQDLLNKSDNKPSIPEMLEKRFETLEGYFDKLHSKYQLILDSLDYDSKSCRYIRTIIYALAYLTRHSNSTGAIYMKNITNVDVGWAVGNENNKNASFYGNSELGKAFAGYYAFMNVKENPYTELINNKYVSEIDYNAMMLHGEVTRSGLLKLLFDGEEMVKEIHKILKMVRNVITILDTPLTFGVDLLGWLKGLVASLTNAAATIIDLSLSELVKMLFFMPVIPIGEKKYSISDIYNYVSFIKLICENADNLEIGTIDRDQFVKNAYDYLGIDKTSISKIGYFAYDRNLNNSNFPQVNTLNMFQNQYDSLFTAKDDLKLLYSLIQFAIQKHIYQTGDMQFEQNFNYSSSHLISNMLQSLDKLEIFYIFNIYGINFYDLKNDLKDIDNSKMLSFNSKLYNTTVNYDHHNLSFYEEYNKADKKILYEKMLGQDFTHSGYNLLINSMKNYYFKAIDYNKKQLDSEVFSANDIADIDDFFMRFIPSIIELAKTLGIEIKTFKQVADLLDSFCKLITDVLFKKLYLNLRIDITEIIKRYTDDMFKKLDFLKTDSFTIDLDLGNTRVVKVLDKIIYYLEKGASLDLDIIEKCFKDFGYSGIGSGTGSGYGTIGDPEGDYEIGTRYPENPDDHGIFTKPDEWEDDLNLRYEREDFNVDRNKQEEFDKQHTEYENAQHSNSNDYNRNDKDKIIYEQGYIIIENPNGHRDVILTPNDDHHAFTDSISKKLPHDQFDKLVSIRDFIENVKDKELVHIQNLITQEENKLKNELNKQIPNYGIIQIINKNIQDLTEELESVKNKNRTMYSESIVLKSFNANQNSNDSDDYAYLNEFFNKSEILDEVEQIVIKNDSPLTNYQITELLK